MEDDPKETNNSLSRASAIGRKKGKLISPSSQTGSCGMEIGLTNIKNKSKALLYRRSNKFELETKEDTENNHKKCLEKIKILNENRNLQNFNVLFELNNFTWPERNLIELIFPSKGNDSVYIFNPFVNKVEEIIVEMDKKFPMDLAICNKLPYCFVSGGKSENKDGEIEELTDFFALRRTEERSFEIVQLPPMQESKSNHCMFEIEYINSICALGGSDSKDVEIFDLENKNWSSLPDLNEVREGAVSCVVNLSFIYCFYGYDSKESKYLTSIEKMDLDSRDEWKLLNPFGNQTFMKRKFCCSVCYRRNFEDNIIIVGGINVLNNESLDCFSYNQITNTLEKDKEALPYKSSFYSNSFIPLPNGIYYNFTSDFQLIQYEPMGRIFFGIREL